LQVQASLTSSQTAVEASAIHQTRLSCQRIYGPLRTLLVMLAISACHRITLDQAVC